MATDFISRIKAALTDCIESARGLGYEGPDDAYEYSLNDLQCVVETVGRKPTREEWKEAGLTWVGSFHVSAHEHQTFESSRGQFCPTCNTDVEVK